MALPQDVLKRVKSKFVPDYFQSVDALRDYNQGIGNCSEMAKTLKPKNNSKLRPKQIPTLRWHFPGWRKPTAVWAMTVRRSSRRKSSGAEPGSSGGGKVFDFCNRVQVAKNYPEAIKAYENFAKASPDNSDVQSALASLYKDSGDLAKARDYNQKILNSNPKDVAATMEMGRLILRAAIRRAVSIR